jgi:2-polyprenyl-3-methyl-5-hydroxy-6-metoxy-1,4-benzoquinol methylase
MAMTQDKGADELAVLRQETQSLWEQKADFWDARMGEGNAFHKQLVAPAAERLLAPQPGETILDVACGNGQFSRQLAALGATVVATDFSATFLARAAARTIEHAERITYQQVDATDEAALLALGVGRFDAAVCNMALMDMPTIAPLLRALRQLLRSGGRFVFTVQHPCFNNNATRLTFEEEDRAGELRETRGVRIAEYLHIPPGKGVGMPGEPVPHYSFHRPLHELLGECFAAGFALDGLEEPAFAPETTSSRALSWAHYRQIPPALVARLRPMPR